MLIDNKLYLEDIIETSEYEIEWKKLKGKTILFTGITGLIGRYFVDLIMYKNNTDNLQCRIIGISRNENKIKELFPKYLENEYFKYYSQDIVEKICIDDKIDYIVHSASNTHPLLYSSDPIGTITTNTLGTKNLLDLALEKNIEKFIYLSSFEVYGKVENKEEIFENDFGVVDCTVLRNCYPESKRIGENLCIAYSEQKNLNCSILRLSRVFGPTMNVQSSLATAQFIRSGVNNEDIILKSEGTQKYSYNYVSDVVTSILTILLFGKNKEAYNVSDEKFDIMLKDFARIVADYSNKKVIFDLPTEIEQKGYSNSVMTILNSKKIKTLGWKCSKDIKYRITQTIDILKK